MSNGIDSLTYDIISKYCISSSYQDMVFHASCKVYRILFINITPSTLSSIMDKGTVGGFQCRAMAHAVDTQIVWINLPSLCKTPGTGVPIRQIGIVRLKGVPYIAEATADILLHTEESHP